MPGTLRPDDVGYSRENIGVPLFNQLEGIGLDLKLLKRALVLTEEPLRMVPERLSFRVFPAIGPSS